MGLHMKIYPTHAAVTSYDGTDSTVVIPDFYEGMPVTHIRAGAFSKNQFLQTVVLPRTLIKIDWWAFADCPNLHSVYPAYARELAEASLPDIHTSVIPSEVQVIGVGAFAHTGLQDVFIEGTDIVLEDIAFRNCASLRQCHIKASGTLQLGGGVFLSSGIERFEAENDQPVYLPYGTFMDCGRLEAVKISASYVESKAFQNCSRLKHLELSEALTHLGEDSFSGCDSLEQIPKVFEETGE